MTPDQVREPTRPPFPAPVSTEDNQPFWDALREGRLVVQECSDCSGVVHPPRPMCPACGSFEHAWRAMSGRGEVYSYVVTHQAIHPSFEGHTPYVTAIVQLEEGPLLTTNLVDIGPDDVAIGMPVVVEFVATSDEVTLPLFRRA